MGAFTISKVQQIVIMSKDTKTSKKFYGEVLGLQRTEEYDGMVFFQIGETILMLHPTDEDIPAKSGIEIEFRVDHVKNLVEKVKQSGLGKIIQEPIDREWGVREVIIEDPNGYEIWFTEAIM